MYAHIQNAKVTWIFACEDLPEFNENDIEVVDITLLSPAPEVGYRYSAGEFSAPAQASPDDLATLERNWRDRQLAATDGDVMRHRDELEQGATTLTPAEYTSLQAYRRALRNWPEAGEFPLSDQRPSAPEWL